VLIAVDFGYVSVVVLNGCCSAPSARAMPLVIALFMVVAGTGSSCSRELSTEMVVMPLHLIPNCLGLDFCTDWLPEW